MKKAPLIFAFIFIASAACQKEYTCVCITENPLGGDDIEIPYEIDKTTKRKAEEACQQQEDEENAGSSNPLTDCELE